MKNTQFNNKADKKPLLKRWYVKGVIGLWIAGAGMTAIIGAIAPEELPSEAKQPPAIEQPAQKEESEAVNIEISEFGKQMAIDEIERRSLVKEAAVTVDEENERITLAVQVNAAMNEKTAKKTGDDFARLIATFAKPDGFEGPDKEYLGELYDHYELRIVVGPGPDNIYASGAKVSWSPKITW